MARAEALIHRGQLVPAVRAYESAHRLDPESDAPLTGMALAWLQLDNPAQARVALDRVLARHPANLEAQLLFARALGVEGSAQAALDQVQRVVAADPQDWRAHDYHGRALQALGKFADAAKAFGTSLRINPLALDARLALAFLLTKQKEHAAAEAQYQHAVRLFQDNPEALNKIAAHMAEHGHAKNATELFQALADAEPNSRSIMMVNIGNAHLQLGDSPSAAASYRQAIQLEPTNALAYSRLGDLENDDGSYDKAVPYFARACELDPQSATYHASAGTAYLQLQDYNRATQYLRRSVELFPEQPLMLYNLAVALAFDGKAEAAVEELAKAVSIDDGYARGWYLKAQIESRLGRAPEAAASARRAAANPSALSAQELEGVRALLT
jgi:tetratricopeptide (TPR) repeat protein